MAVDHASADFQAFVDRNRAFGEADHPGSPNPKATGSDLYVAPKRDGEPVTEPEKTDLVIPPEKRRRYNA